MIEKIISGGQTGADIGGLLFAEFRGLETGGWMPNGWATEDGARPEYAELYGMVEHPALGYAARTNANARDSDGTVRFASKWGSPGERCTEKAIRKHKKPHYDVDVNDPPPPEEMAMWIHEHHIKVLNVAGNRETTSPGIRDFVMRYLAEAIDEANKIDNIP
jgi:hypothetical protein